MKNIIKWKNTIFIVSSVAFFTGCTGTTSVSVGYGVYGGYGYPSYGYGGGYYGGGFYRPPHNRPDRPNRPIHRPNRPTTLPGHTRPSRPSGSMRSMGRPSGGMRRGRR